MSERKQVASQVSPEAHKAIHERAEVLDQTVSKTAAEILERHLNARTNFDSLRGSMAGLETEVKAAAADLKIRKRAWARDESLESSAAYENARSNVEKLHEKLDIVREDLADAQALLDAATAEANQVRLDALKSEADALWDSMQSTVQAAAAAVIATRAEFQKFEAMRAQLTANASQRKGLGARLTDEEYRWDGLIWYRACQKAFSAAHSGEFPMSELDARQVAYLLYNSTPYNLR
jgi:tetrahydromethanopterin S-methyltransferase subunit G